MSEMIDEERKNREEVLGVSTFLDVQITYLLTKCFGHHYYMWSSTVFGGLETVWPLRDSNLSGAMKFKT